MKNEQTYIKGLLQKFMEGETTQEELRTLTDFFRGKNVPNEWSDYKLLFEPETQELLSFTEKEIDNIATQPIEIEPQRNKKTNRMLLWLKYTGIAAAILFAFFFGRMNGQLENTVPQMSARIPETVTDIIHDTVYIEKPVIVKETVPVYISKQKSNGKQQPPEQLASQQPAHSTKSHLTIIGNQSSATAYDAYNEYERMQETLQNAFN